MLLDAASGSTSIEYIYAIDHLGSTRLSTDPSRESIRLDNPQTWNRYSYVLNNPLELVDPTGEVWDITGAIPQWVDECSQTGTCVNTIALNNTNTSVTVYGSQGAEDVTTYQANSSGMINMRDISSNASAEFDVAGGQPHPEEYLNPQAAAGLYNIADIYHQDFPSDSKVVFTAGSTDSGKPATEDNGQPAHVEHNGGKDADLRYMGSDGKPIRGKGGARGGDIQRNGTLAHLLGNRTLTGNPTKYGTIKINNAKTQAAHQDHMHGRDVK
ncbi:MAG TPA: hypothetical protein VGI16_08540 [Candidatus Acidoferrum sp.]|jgi:hypothetical protein